jgi:hypothetical protein
MDTRTGIIERPAVNVEALPYEDRPLPCAAMCVPVNKESISSYIIHNNPMHLAENSVYHTLAPVNYCQDVVTILSLFLLQ